MRAFSTTILISTIFFVNILFGNKVSILFTANINATYQNCNCDSNPLGGIDSYTFKARKREEIRFRSKTFEKVVEQGYALKDRGQTVLSVTGYDGMELFSDILTNTELQWIGELGLSNNVWIDDGNTLI